MNNQQHAYGLHKRSHAGTGLARAVPCNPRSNNKSDRVPVCSAEIRGQGRAREGNALAFIREVILADKEESKIKSKPQKR